MFWVIFSNSIITLAALYYYIGPHKLSMYDEKKYMKLNIPVFWLPLSAEFSNYYINIFLIVHTMGLWM